MALHLCKNLRKFAQSEQTVSVANTLSIINNLLLSFPWSNHSTQQHWNPASSSLDQWLVLLLLPLWEKTRTPKETHSQIPQSVGASGPVWLCGAARQEELYKLYKSCAWSKGHVTWQHCFCLVFYFFTFLVLSLKTLKSVACVAFRDRENYRATFFFLSSFFKSPWIWLRGWNSWSILALCPRNLVLRCW